jgi:hypothetical protein
MSNDKEFEDFFRKRFDDFGEEPPDKAWENIQAELKGKGHRRPGFFWLWATLIGLVLLSVPLGIYFTGGGQSPEARIATEPSAPQHHTAAAQPTDSLSNPAKRDQQGAQAERSPSAPEPADLFTDSAAVARKSRRLEPAPGNQAPDLPAGYGIKGELESPGKDVRIAKKPGEAERISTPAQKRNPSEKTVVIVDKRRANDPKKERGTDATPLSTEKKPISHSRKRSKQPSRLQPKEEANETLPGQTFERSLTYSRIRKEKKATALNHQTDAERALLDGLDSTQTKATLRKQKERVGKAVKPDQDLIETEREGAEWIENKGTQPGLSTAASKEGMALANIQPVSLIAIRLLPITPADWKPKPDSTVSTSPPPSSPKYAFGLYYSPRYSFSRFLANTEDPIFVDQIQTRGRPLNDRLGYEIGLTVSRRITDRWSLQGSLMYVQIRETVRFRSQSLHPDSIYINPSPSDTMNLTPVFNAATQRYQSVYNYAGLNLGVTYAWLKGSRGEVYFSAGMGLRVLVRGSTERYTNDQWKETIYFPAPDNPLEQLNSQFSLGIGYARKLSPFVRLTVEPTISYFLGSTFREREPLGIKPYTVGINVGLQLGR